MSACCSHAMQTSKAGILIISQSPDRDTQKSIDDIIRKAGRTMPPVETTSGTGEKDLQRAVERLQNAGVKRIKVLPLFYNSQDEDLGVVKYALGLTKRPPKSFAGQTNRFDNKLYIGSPKPKERKTIRQINIKVPISISPALDRHPMAVQAVMQKVLESAKGPSCLLLVGKGPQADDISAGILKNLEYLASEVKTKLSLVQAEGALLRPDSDKTVQENCRKRLKMETKRMSKDCRVIVVEHSISDSGLSRDISKALEGTLYSWAGASRPNQTQLQGWLYEKIGQEMSMSDIQNVLQ